MWHKKTSLEALLDCGATHNFIDTHTAEKLKIRVCPLWQPLIVNNVDGTMNSGGNITHFCNLWLMHGEVTHKQGFYVANLGWDWLILGHPWFKTFNPAIDWSTSTLQGDDMMWDSRILSKGKNTNSLSTCHFTKWSGSRESRNPQANSRRIPPSLEGFQWKNFSPLFTSMGWRPCHYTQTRSTCYHGL